MSEVIEANDVEVRGNSAAAIAPCRGLAEETAANANRPDVARVARLRATALRVGRKPQPPGGL